MKKHLFSLLLLAVLMPLSMQAQNSRSYLRDKISEWGECKNVAITNTNGDLALYGSNGWAGTGLPSALSKALNELNEDGAVIKDVVLTEEGAWLVLHGRNGYRLSYGLPERLENKIEEFNEKGYEITSVACTDAGRWVIVSTEYFAASASWIQDWLKEGFDEYGSLWSVALSGDAMVAVYDRGYKYYGDVPSGLKTALRESKLDAYYVKIAGESWFFADKSGSYRYNM